MASGGVVEVLDAIGYRLVSSMIVVHFCELALNNVHSRQLSRPEAPGSLVTWPVDHKHAATSSRLAKINWRGGDAR